MNMKSVLLPVHQILNMWAYLGSNKMQIHFSNTILDIIHRPVFYLKNMMYRRLDSVYSDGSNRKRKSLSPEMLCF
jgi:hypothetical protein